MQSSGKDKMWSIRLKQALESPEIVHKQRTQILLKVLSQAWPVRWGGRLVADLVQSICVRKVT